MDAGEAQERLRDAKDLVNADPSEYTREFLLVDKTDADDNEYTAGEVPIHKNIQVKISKWVLEQLQTELDRINDDPRAIAQYDIENRNKTQISVQYIESDNIPFFDRFKSIINGDSFPETTYEDTPDPSFQVFRAIDRLHQNRFAAFRVFTKRQIIGTSSKIKAALRGDEYDIFKKKVVALPDTYDVVFYNGIFFVFKPGNFEKTFDYFETYERTAREVFEHLQESDLAIHDLDQFKQTVLQDHNSLRKMSEIEQCGLYDSLTLDGAEEIIDKYGLNLVIETDSEGNRGIKIPDLRHRHDLLRLLNDDHLASDLTEDIYQVYGKDRR